MRNNILKTSVILALGVIAVIGVGISSQNQNLHFDLLLQNVEALAGTSPETDEFKCVMTKDDCYIENITEYTLSILVGKYGGFGSFKVGDRVDISTLTQLYALAEYPWEDKIRCGKDISCNDLMSSLK